MWKRFAFWAIKLLAKAAAAEMAKRIRTKQSEALKLEYEAGRPVAQAAQVKAEAEALAAKGLEAIFKADA